MAARGPPLFPDPLYSPLQNLQFILSYTKQDVESGGDPNPLQNGAKEIGSFDYGWGFVTSYTFKRGALDRLGVGAAISYTDDVTKEGVSVSNGVPYQREARGQYEGAVFLSYPTRLFGRTVVFRFNANNLFERELYIGYDPGTARDIGGTKIAYEPYYLPTKPQYFISATMRF